MIVMVFCEDVEMRWMNGEGVLAGEGGVVSGVCYGGACWRVVLVWEVFVLG